jgi:hypothetical protein
MWRVRTCFLPPLSWQLPSSLLLPPHSPNAIALSAAIAAAVAIAHLFDTAIKQQGHGQWRWKQWLRQHAIAAAVAMAHLFNTTIKHRWRGQWQWKQWLR